MEKYTEIKKILKWLKGRDHNNTDPTILLQILNIMDIDRKWENYHIRQYLFYSANEDLKKLERNRYLSKHMIWEHINGGEITKTTYFDNDREWFKSKGVIYELIGQPPYRLIRPVTKRYGEYWIEFTQIYYNALTSPKKHITHNREVSNGYHKMDKQLLDLDDVVREIKLILKQINVELI